MTDPSGRVTMSITNVYDGTGHGTSAQCALNSANGFPGGDDDALDGVACTSDQLGYRIDYNVKQSDTPTTIVLKIDSRSIQPDGSVLKEGDREMTWDFYYDDNDSIKNFCKGGTGLYHTGVWDQSSSTCTMTFPAGSPGTGSATIYGRTVGPSGMLTTRLRILEAARWDGKELARAEANPVKMIDTPMVDPELLTPEAPKLTYVGGKPGMATPINLFPKWVGFRTKGGSNPNTSDPKKQLRGDFVIDFSEYPAGTKVTVPAGWTYDETTRIATANDIVVRAGLSEEPGQNENSLVKFSVWTPLSAYDTSKDQTWKVRITKADLASQWGYYPKNYNGQPEPGLGESTSYDTADRIVRGSRTGRAGSVNNDYTVVTYDALAGAGSLSKTLVEDTNGKPGDRLYGQYDAVGAETPFWSVLTAKPTASANTTGTRFCDTFKGPQDEGQSFDTSREPIVTWWNEKTNSYATPKYHIEYGTTRASAPWVYNSNRDINEACNNNAAAWKSSPDATTNVVRVVMDEDLTWQADSDYVGRISLPMKMLSASGYSQYPNITVITDNYAMDATNSDKWAGPVNAMMRVGGPFNDLSGPEAPPIRHVNAGSSTTFQPNAFTVRHTGVFGPNDSDDMKLAFTTTVGSCVSDLQFPQTFKDNYSYTVDTPDWGADGLPCTGDDVHGWTVNARALHTTPLVRGESYNSADKNRMGQWTYAVPGYVKGGTSIPVVSNGSMIAEDGLATETPGYLANNVDSRTIIVDTAATVGQSKFTTTPLVQVGQDVSWTTAWFNQAQVATGQSTFIDVLPYNGDSLGTKLTKPLTDVRIANRANSNGATIYVSTDDPKTISPDATAASNAAGGSTKWVAYTGESKVDGKDITAVKVVQDKMDPGYIGGITLTAATTGDKDAEFMFNRLGVAKVDGFNLPIPTTAPVRSDLWNTVLSGTAYWDANNNGSRDTNETRVFADATVNVYDGDGNVLATTKTDENGYWEVQGIPLSDYAVEVADRGGNIKANWTLTEPAPDGIYATGDGTGLPALSLTHKRQDGLDFGFFNKIAPKLSIVKSAQGIANGGSITNGTMVTWNYVVKNDGDSEVTNIKVSDNRGVEVTCPKTVLPAGESMTCTGSGAVAPTTD